MKIFVTGGAGFIGSHLVDRLVSDKNDVIVTDNLYRGKKENIADHLISGRVTFYETDIRNYDSVYKAMKDCEIVFHLAAQSNVIGADVDLDYSFGTNVIGTYNVLKAAKACGIKRLIFTSSREAYGEAISLPVKEDHPLRSKNFYGASKVAGEKYCEIYRNMNLLDVVILRLSNVYGPRDADRVIPIFIDNVRNNKKIKIYGGRQLIDFISVEKCVDVLIGSITNQKAVKGATNIGSGKGTTLFELAERIKAILNSTTEVTVEPARSTEVVKYVADIKRMSGIFNISINDDPLYFLPGMLKS